MISPPVLLALGLAGAAALLTTCEGSLQAPAVQRRADEGRQQLQGTWLREYGEKGTQVRRLLALDAGGAFRESVRVVEPSGGVTEYRHEGTWLFDGTNLKRKYTLMNGQPPSRLNVPFATFEIAFESRNAFTGVDHIHHHEVHYRRVAFDTPSGDQGR
jgi:hypothetical protein